MVSPKSDIHALLKAVMKLPAEALRELQGTINGLLKSVAVVERIRQKKPRATVRLDDATPEQLLEERAYLQAEWDPICNVDRDRMVEGALVVEFEVQDCPHGQKSREVKSASPILYDGSGSQRYPSEHIALEFFKQFLDCERADKRFNRVTPEMLLIGFREYADSGEYPSLWGYINDIDEHGTTLSDSVTGSVITIDISEGFKELIEDIERYHAGKPKIIRRKPYEEEDVYDRVKRKYRLEFSD